MLECVGVLSKAEGVQVGVDVQSLWKESKVKLGNSRCKGGWGCEVRLTPSEKPDCMSSPNNAGLRVCFRLPVTCNAFLAADSVQAMSTLEDLEILSEITRWIIFDAKWDEVMRTRMPRDL